MAGPQGELVFAPLGGVGEIGMNLSIYGLGDARRRNKTVVQVNLRAERKLTRRLKWYMDYEYEQSLANVPWDKYVVNSVSSGFNFEY